MRGVNFGSAPFEPPPRDAYGRPLGGAANRRAEMWMKSKEWLEDSGGTQISDSDSLLPLDEKATLDEKALAFFRYLL